MTRETVYTLAGAPCHVGAELNLDDLSIASTMTTAVEALTGEVERIVDSGDETGYTVCRLNVRGSPELVTAVGVLPGVQLGEQLILDGHWVNHAKFGLQFQASSYETRLPASSNAIKRYLSSNLVKGIGPVMAGRLVDMTENTRLKRAVADLTLDAGRAWKFPSAASFTHSSIDRRSARSR